MMNVIVMPKVVRLMFDINTMEITSTCVEVKDIRNNILKKLPLDYWMMIQGLDFVIMAQKIRDYKKPTCFK